MLIELPDRIYSKLKDISSLSNQTINGVIEKAVESYIKKSISDKKSVIKDKQYNRILKNLTSSSKEITNELAYKISFQQALVETLPYPIFIKDKNGRFLGCNRAYEDVFNTNREYLLNKTVLELEYLPMKERIRFHREDMKVIKEAGRRSIELPITYADGKTHITLYSVDGFKLSDGKPVGLIGLLVDITEQKKTEEVLKLSEEKYRALVENTVDLIWETDTNLTFKYISPQIKKIVGYEQSEAIGRRLLEFLVPEDSKRVENALPGLRKATSQITGIPVNCVHKNGSIVSMEVSFIPVFNRQNKLTGFRGINRDITQRMKTEQEVMKLHNLESVSILAGGIAHDFRNILTVINGQATIAKLKSTDENINKNMDSILEATKTAVKLTNELFSFAENKAQTNKITPIKKIIKDTTAKILFGTNINFHFEFFHTNQISCDPLQFKQLIQNIVTNSKESLHNKGKLSISTSDVTDNKTKYIKIVINDTGTGIKKENLDKIFAPYFSTKTRNRIKGSGLGLAVCHSIVQRHNGKISVASEEGEGTTINILLPASRKL